MGADQIIVISKLQLHLCTFSQLPNISAVYCFSRTIPVKECSSYGSYFYVTSLSDSYTIVIVIVAYYVHHEICPMIWLSWYYFGFFTLMYYTNILMLTIMWNAASFWTSSKFIVPISEGLESVPWLLLVLFQSAISILHLHTRSATCRWWSPGWSGLINFVLWDIFPIILYLLWQNQISCFSFVEPFFSLTHLQFKIGHSPSLKAF